MIALVGVAGCGKTTQRDMLAEQLDCSWVYTGELLRNNLAGDQKARLDGGQLIDDRITMALLDQAFIDKDVKNHECILDGSPRSVTLAEWFADKVKTGQFKLTGFIHLVITPQVAQQRLAGRGRQDDSQASIAERFRVYETRTKPAFEYLRAQGIEVHEINAAGSPEEVNRLVRQALNLPVAAKVAQ